MSSTEQFLSAIFGGEQSNAYITAFTDDPTGDYTNDQRGRMWGGGTYEERRSRLTKDTNQYVVVSTFNASRAPKDKGKPRRQRALFKRCYAVMVDDIGDESVLTAKVRWDSVKLKDFTALVETSPGNFQGWYALDHSDPDAADARLVDYLVDQMIKLGLAKVDPGMKGVTRYGRLPAGVNNKAKLGKPWTVRAEYINGVSYTLKAIADAYGIDLAEEKEKLARPPKPGSRVVIDADDREKYINDLLNALERQGCEPHEHPNKRDAYDVKCPWWEAHTAGKDDGSMLFMPGYVNTVDNQTYDAGGYKCHHGHCEGKRMRHVVQWLNEHGEELHPAGWLTMPPLIQARTLGPEVKMARSEEGKILKTDDNLDRILRKDTQFNSSGFRLAWDAFSDLTNIVWETDTHSRALSETVPDKVVPPELVYYVKLDIIAVHGVRFSTTAINEALTVILSENRFDSGQDWANAKALEWDGVPRLERWLIDYTGAKDNAYVRRVSEVTMLAAAKRLLCPGFKFDNMLILEGAQGIRKSTLLALLAPEEEWYASTQFDARQVKDAVSDRLGKVIVEVEELQSVKRSDTGALKGFLSRTSDRVRLSYARRSADYPRRCVYIGTTNDEYYLTDTTGARRFWPVNIGSKVIDTEGFMKVKSQLWAESCARASKSNDQRDFQLSVELLKYAATEADERQKANDDPWNRRIPIYAEQLYSDAKMVHMTDILDRLKIDESDQNQGHVLRASAILRRHGWVPMKRYDKGHELRIWMPYEMT